MSRPGVVALILAAAFGLLVIASSIGERRFSCEVCISFEGRSKCRTAGADGRDEAIQMATDNACAFIVSGRVGLINCGRTVPTSVECEER